MNSLHALISTSRMPLQNDARAMLLCVMLKRRNFMASSIGRPLLSSPRPPCTFLTCPSSLHSSSLRPCPFVPLYPVLTAPIRIDCGGEQDSVVNGIQWLSDRGYKAGDGFLIASGPNNGLNPVEYSLRAFTGSSKGCYQIPVPGGRYMVRLGFAYYNYDAQNAPPVFGVYVQNTLAETVDMSVVQGNFVQGAYYSDYITYAFGGSISVCFVPAAGSPGPPIVSSLEVLPVDTDAYDAGSLGQNVLLSTYVRLNMGGPQVGPEPVDNGFRTWMGDVSPTNGNFSAVNLEPSTQIQGTGVAPDYLPATVFQTAREASTPMAIGGFGGNATGFRMTVLPVDVSNTWYIRYYFMEPDVTAQPGDRLFVILLGSGSEVKAIGSSSNGFDILSKVPPRTALVVPVFFNFSSFSSNFGQDLEVGVRSMPGMRLPAILQAVELFEVIPTQTSSSGEALTVRGAGGREEKERGI